jgi:hypothetical protein
VYAWNGMRDKEGKVDSLEVYLGNDEISRWIVNGCCTKTKLNSMVWVRERPPRVGEVIANFCG